MKERFTPRYALITGASSGIGLEYARQLAAAGVQLLLVSNQPEALEQAAEELSARYGATIHARFFDLAAPDAADALMVWCDELGAKPDLLINNAGIFIFNPIIKTNSGRIDTILQLHVVTTTRLCRLVGERMAQHGRGRILNMSSLSAWTPMPGIACYAATKAYLRTFSRALAYELHPQGVRVTVVCPGAIATSLYNLAPRYQRLGLRLGILMTPERLVRRALRASFRGRAQVVPGWLNRLFIPLIALFPARLVRSIGRKMERYER